MAALEVVKSMKQSLGKSPATSTRREIEFTCSAPKAKSVCLAGQFNDWNMTAMSMKKSPDGTWRIKLKLLPGKYEYKFVVDGAWVQDASCSTSAFNSFGTQNSVLTV